MKSLRIGIIGSGFAQNHISAISQIEYADVVAICSRNKKRAKQICNGSYYSFDRYLQMLEKENLDAIYICLPPHLHQNMEKACAEHVKGLFIEKPVSTTLEQGYNNLNIFNQTGTIVSVGYMNRYRSNLRIARDYFSTSAPVLINTAWCGGLPQPYWWRRREMSGGQLTEQCTHFLDAIRYINGEFEEVSAFANSGFIDDIEGFNVDDSVVMNFRMKSGAIGNAMTSCFSRNHNGGSIGLFLNIASRNQTYRFSDHKMDLEIQYGNGRYEVRKSIEDVLLIENRIFLEALTKDNSSTILSSYADSLKTLEVSFAAYLSIVEKRSVKISEL